MKQERYSLFVILSVWCFIFGTIFTTAQTISPESTDSYLRDIVARSKINTDSELKDFYVESQECIVSSASACSNPLLSDGNYPCLGEWVACIRKTKFYLDYNYLYPMDYALRIAVNYSTNNPIQSGNTPTDLLTQTNDVVFLVSSARVMLFQFLSSFSKTTDFWNEMISEYDRCANLAIQTASPNTATCGKSAQVCYNGSVLTCFSNEPFYKSYKNQLSLNTLLRLQNYTARDPAETVPIPDCDATNSCTQQQIALYIEQRRGVFLLNLFYLLFNKANVSTKLTVDTSFWVFFAIVMALVSIFVIIGFLVPMCKSKHRHHHEHDEHNQNTEYTIDRFDPYALNRDYGLEYDS